MKAIRVRHALHGEYNAQVKNGSILVMTLLRRFPVAYQSPGISRRIDGKSHQSSLNTRDLLGEQRLRAIGTGQLEYNRRL